RRTIREEDELTFAKLLWQPRPKVAKNVKLHFERLAVVHVGLVLALPEERFAAGNDVQAGGINLAGPQKTHVLVWKVFANNANQADRREEAGREGEVRGGSPQDALAQSRRGLNR